MKVSCLSLNSILRVLYFNIANLQSVTVNLDHTAQIPVFLDLLQCCFVMFFRWNCSSCEESSPCILGVSVKCGVKVGAGAGAGFYLKECCFRVRVRFSSVNPNPKTVFF